MSDIPIVQKRRLQLLLTMVTLTVTICTIGVMGSSTPSSDSTAFGCSDEEKEDIVVLQEGRLTGDEVQEFCTKRGFDRTSPKYVYSYDPPGFWSFTQTQAFNVTTDKPAQVTHDE